jgi:hypothetical protein
MEQIWEDFWRSVLDWLGGAVNFVCGLAFVLACSVLPAAGEILDDLSTSKGAPINWLHVAKVVLPISSGAVLAYLYHVKTVSKALATIPAGMTPREAAGALISGDAVITKSGPPAGGQP